MQSQEYKSPLNEEGGESAVLWPLLELMQ
jgi:hypothetical protein